MVPLLGTEFVPKADFSETTVNFYTPVGSSLEVTEAKARQVEGHRARVSRGALHAVHHQHRQRAGQDVRQRLCAPGGPQGAQRSVDEMSGVLRERLKQVPGITVTHVGLLDSVGGNKQVEFSLQGPDLQGTRTPDPSSVSAALRDIPGPGRPGLQREGRQAGDSVECAARRGVRPGPVCGQIAGVVAHPGGGPDGGQLARQPDDQTYDVNVRLAPDATQRPPRPGAPALCH
jgi:HAE1 family hydrophobic/amphiphilic exporter-1